MSSHTFTTGRIRLARYESTTRELELQWDSGTVRVYRHVPHEVYRRLCSAPNPTTYWEDRIAEEYPQAPSGTARSDTDKASQKALTLRDLLGDAD